MATRKAKAKPKPKAVAYVPVVGDWVKIRMRDVQEFARVSAVRRTSSPTTHSVTVHRLARVDSDRDVFSEFPKTFKWRDGVGFVHRAWDTETAERSTRAEAIAFLDRASFWGAFRKKADRLVTLASQAPWGHSAARDSELYADACAEAASLTALLHEEKARRLDQLAPGPTSADPATNPDHERRKGS